MSRLNPRNWLYIRAGSKRSRSPSPAPVLAPTPAPVLAPTPAPPSNPQDHDDDMADATTSPPARRRTPSLNVPRIQHPTPQPYETQSSTYTISSRPPSPSFPLENESAALAALNIQCSLPLATVAVELVPIPRIGTIVECLTVVFQAVEKSRVNREQWRLLKGRCVMVSRIAGAQVSNYGCEHYYGLENSSRHLHDTIAYIGDRANYWNEMNEMMAFGQFQSISDEIKNHFSALDWCLAMFSYAADVAQTQWIGEFNAVQQRELSQLKRMRSLMQEKNMRLDFTSQTPGTVNETITETRELLKKAMDEKFEIVQNQATTPAAISDDAKQILQTIRTVTNIQLPSSLLVGRQCILDANVPIRTGITCDIYSAWFLANEKVAKKVFRIGMSEKEHVERYANRFLRQAKLWAEFKCDYTLPFYGIGMEAFETDKHFQLYMVSPLMLNFDAATYVKKHRNNPGMKEGIMRIITDAAKGLHYLHNRELPVVHSGMRGENILVTDSGGGVLGGFGLTKALQSCTGPEKVPPAVMTGKTESQRWMAPEMFMDDNPVLQTPSDVWGWAMTTLELISGRTPYYHNKQTHTVILDIRFNKRPLRAKYADFETYALKPDEMWALLERCWATDPEERPTIDEVLIDLKKMSKARPATKITFETPNLPNRNEEEVVARQPRTMVGHTVVDQKQQVHHIRSLTNDSGNSLLPSGGVSTSTDLTATENVSPIKSFSPAPQNCVPISRSMLIDEVIAHLLDHGCLDVTNMLDLTSAGEYPDAHGGYCDVFRMLTLHDRTPVAVKVRKVLNREEADHFKEAARELYAWSKCNHPNVMKLLGFAKFRDRIAIVSTWMGFGTLPEYMKKYPEADRCWISTQICEGIAYLHSCNIGHGDLKGLNILVSSNGTPAIMDFGNATLKNPTLGFTGLTANPSMTARWAAPELLDGSGTHSMEADVYALGMTILEIISGKVPFDGKPNLVVLSLVMTNKQTPPRPNDTIPSNSEHGDKLWVLLTRCWSREPKDRPSAKAVTEIMSTITREGLKARA